MLRSKMTIPVCTILSSCSTREGRDIVPLWDNSEHAGSADLKSITFKKKKKSITLTSKGVWQIMYPTKFS